MTQPTMKFAPDLQPIRYTERYLRQRFELFEERLAKKTADRVLLDAWYDNSHHDTAMISPFEDEGGKGNAREASRKSERSRGQRMRDRIAFLLDASKRATGFSHLPKDEQSKLEPILRPVSLVGPLSEAEADEIAAKLVSDLPWMSAVIDVLWRDIRLNAEDGLGLKFRPILIDGPPSAGKTHLARSLSEITGAPDLVIDVGGGSDGFRIAGSNRTWAKGTPSRIVEKVIEKQVGNPIVFVDEIDKAGTVTTTSGTSTSITTSLLGLLEQRSAKRWECPYFGVVFDMSRINWILASNDASQVPVPLQTRLQIVRVAGPTRGQLLAVAEKLIKARGLTEDDLAVIEKITAALPDGHHDLCLRGVLRIVDDLTALARMPALN